LKNPADLYIGILKSRTVSDAIVAQFHLQQVYRIKLLSAGRKALQANVAFESGKDSLIKITVTDHDPRRAAAMANAFVEELHKENSRLALSDASQRRLFFEEQLRQEKDALANAEVDLKRTQEGTGLIVPAGQAEVLIRSGATLRAEITSHEVQLQAMRSFATDENPQVQVLQRELAALRSELARVEADDGSGSKLELSGRKLPEASLEYIRKMREVKYHETLFELLAKQYEISRLDEAKQAPVVQVVDRAAVPDRKSGPPRLLAMIGAFLGGLVLSSLYVLIADMLAKQLPRWRQGCLRLRAA
jgi:capsule polysaccharide export protein KpsE/RkpR